MLKKESRCLFVEERSCFLSLLPASPSQLLPLVYSPYSVSALPATSPSLPQSSPLPPIPPHLPRSATLSISPLSPPTMATATTPGRLALQATNTRSHSVRTAAQDASTRPAAPLFDAERQFLNALGTGTGAVAGPSNTGSRSVARPVQAAATSRKRAHGEVIESNSPDALTAAAHAAKKRAVGTTTTAGQPLDPNTKRKVKRADPAQKEKLAQESAQWRAKYKKAFPSFTFYFDSIDENTKTMLSSQVRKLGAVRFLFSFPVLSISTRPI